jgi:hypothetical protein
MFKWYILGVVVAIWMAVHLAEAKTYRSPQVRREFQREHPCLSTGKTHGARPGWIKDHIVPLCKDGADATWNLQWQTVADARARAASYGRGEQRLCASPRRPYGLGLAGQRAVIMLC